MKKTERTKKRPTKRKALVFVRPEKGDSIDTIVDALAEPMIKWINEERAKRGLPPLPKE